MAELDQLQAETGMSKTDLVNRAVSMLAFFSGHLTVGDHVLIRDGRSGEVERVRFL